jgi:hypothetical protein
MSMGANKTTGSVADEREAVSRTVPIDGGAGKLSDGNAHPHLMSRVRSPRARRIDVSEQTQALDTLAKAQYAAAWEVAIAEGDKRSAKQWAQATFEDAPRALRAFLVAGWTAGLGLHLGPRPSPDHVLGWKIVTAAPDLIVLSVQSALLGTAHLVVAVERSRVVLTSLVRYEKRGARPIWSTIQPVHHQVIPYLLGRGASHPRCPT